MIGALKNVGAAAGLAILLPTAAVIGVAGLAWLIPAMLLPERMRHRIGDRILADIDRDI